MYNQLLIMLTGFLCTAAGGNKGGKRSTRVIRSSSLSGAGRHDTEKSKLSFL